IVRKGWRPGGAAADAALKGPLYFDSVVTVTGESRRIVIGSPARRVAVLRSPAAVAAVPAPAPARPPTAAPLPPPRIAPRIVPATAAPPTFAAVELPFAAPSRSRAAVESGGRGPAASRIVWTRMASSSCS